MKRLVNLLRDVIKCITIGLIITAAIFLIAGGIALLANKGSISVSLEVVKSILLIVGSLGLLLCAILILKKKSEEPLKYIDEWKKKFGILSYKLVLAFVSLTILLCGGFLDWILFYKL